MKVANFCQEILNPHVQGSYSRVFTVRCEKACSMQEPNIGSRPAEHAGVVVVVVVFFLTKARPRGTLREPTCHSFFRSFGCGCTLSARLDLQVPGVN